MATSIPVFDGHNDTLLSFYLKERGEGKTFFDKTDIGHIDLPRAKEGGFAGGFFAVFLPNPEEEEEPDSEHQPPKPELPEALDLGYAQNTAMGIAAELFRIEAQADGAVKICRTANELEEAINNGVLATILHFEGAEAIDKDLNSLEVFYQAGLRSLGIVWSRPTLFGSGVPFRFNHTPDIGPGLTDTGKRLVKRCNELGIMLDLSHLNEKGFWDVAATSNAPLVATHSNVHAICPSPRNLTDKQLDAIKESEGMVGLNFATGFLSPEGDWGKDLPLETMVRHIDYLVEKLGEDHVGFGSDFDGAGISQYIGDVSGVQNLIQALRDHGYDDALLHKIGHENWVRVLRKTWH